MTRFVLCDGNNINSYGFRTNLNGLNLERFNSNPVMLFSHDSEKVIGRWEDIKIEDGKLTAEAIFDEEDEDGKKIAGKVKRGFLKGCSIGMYVEYMDVDENGVVTALKAELLEASICAIPSDSNAIVLYDQNRKRLSVDEVKQMCLSINHKNSIMTEQEIKQLQASVSEKDTKIAELQKENEELKTQIATAKKNEVEAFLEAKIAEGKIDKSEKEGFAKLAVNDFETVKSIVDGRKPKQTLSLASLQSSGKQNTSGRDNWNYIQWMKEDPEGLARLKAENPSEFERLQKTL